MIALFSIALLAATPAAGQKVASADAAEKSADPRDKMICKRFIETGSLVRGYRTCKTKAEWDRERANINQTNTGVGGCARMGQGAGC